MQTDFILIKQLTMRLSGQEVLQNLNLSIDAGKTVALVGANGSGKSTLLNVLVGVLKPEQGTLLINNQSYTTQPGALQIKRLLGYAPDSPPLYPNDTVESYLKFMAHLRQIPVNEIKPRVDEYMEIFALNSSRKAKISKLSKGLQQRVNLAQAMLHNPRLLLLDEPTNALDLEHIDTLVKQLRVLQQQMVTTIIATHNYTDLLPLCDYMLKIQSGNLQQIMLPHKTTQVIPNDQTHIPA